MSNTMPKIAVTFEQRAASLISRSERGIAVLIVKDNTDQTFTLRQYSDLTALEADKDKYTADNYQAIRDMLAFAPFKAYVYRMDTDGTLADALGAMARTVKTGWITIADMQAADATALASWIKAQEANARSYKAVVYNAVPAPDCMHVVNFVNQSVTFADGRGAQDGNKYLPSLCAILALCNVQRGCTNYACSNLSYVQEVADNDAAIGKGQFILFNDEDGAVRIGNGVNSLVSTDGKTKTEDMQFIETVEAMDLMRDDITRVFRTEYQGSYRNSRDNQMLFVAAINSSYFRQLMQQDILDSEYANAAEIDVDEQRAAWVASGNDEAALWDDDKVRSMAFKRSVFLAARVKILGSMTDLTFRVSME